MLFISVQTSI